MCVCVCVCVCVSNFYLSGPFDFNFPNYLPASSLMFCCCFLAAFDAANVVSHVGQRNKVGHSARRHERLKQVPVMRAAE